MRPTIVLGVAVLATAATFPPAAGAVPSRAPAPAAGPAAVAAGVASTWAPGAPARTTSQAARTAGDRAAQAAAELVADRPAVLHASAGDTFRRLPVVSSAQGLQYVPFVRTYRGLLVYGGDAVVVTDRHGTVLWTSVAQRTAIRVATTPRRSATDAATTARAVPTPAVLDSTGPPRLVVDALGTPRLAWETVLYGHIGDRPSVRRVFTDATSGAVLGQRDEVADGDGRGGIYRRVGIATHRRSSGFSMTDPTRPGLSCRNFHSDAVLTGRDDVWGNFDGTRIETGCVDALYSAQREWDMFRDWFGRNGIDGAGHGFPLLVGLDDVNAFWSGSYVAIGRNIANRFIGAFDVVGHELGHALDATTPGGTAGNGVAEATGDIMGTAVEFYADDRHDPPDFSIGEAVNLVGTGPIRLMYDPEQVGDPGCYSPAVPFLDEHAAAGPLDHWFTLLAKGSAAAGGQPASPTCDGSTATGVGVRTAAQIFYNAMLSKTTAMDYPRYRTATLYAAKNLFPADCARYDAVRAAWDAINVPAQPADPTC